MFAQKDESSRRPVVEEILVDTRSRESASHCFQRDTLFGFIQNLKLLNYRNMGACRSHAKSGRIAHAMTPMLASILCSVIARAEMLRTLRGLCVLGVTFILWVWET